MAEPHIPGVVQAEIDKARAEGRVEGMAIALRIVRDKLRDSDAIAFRWEDRLEHPNVPLALWVESTILSESADSIRGALQVDQHELEGK